MIRSRVWILTLLAGLLVAGPALAYSWPVLFGLPAVFGQESSRSEQTQRVMPYADQAPTRCQATATHAEVRCQLLGDCLTAWEKLWQQGKFREALDLARCAVQAAPDNVNAQHAFAVSQLVNQATFPLPLPCVAQPSTCCPYPAATTSTPARTVSAQTTGLQVDVEIDCPLMGFLETLFGGGCSKTNACNKRTEGQSSCGVARTGSSQNGAKVIWIVREPAPSEDTFASLPPLPVLPLPSPQYFMPPGHVMPLPPPHFAPPPPPLGRGEFVNAYIPVPVDSPRPEPQPLRVHTIRFDQAEQCEAPSISSLKLPAHVRITQNGQHVQLSSPHYDARCERIRGGANGQLILEGNVRLMSRRHGQTMTISAQRVLLNVKDDQFVVEQAEGMEASRVHIAPIGSQPVSFDVLTPASHLTPVRIHGGVNP